MILEEIKKIIWFEVILKGDVIKCMLELEIGELGVDIICLDNVKYLVGFVWVVIKNWFIFFEFFFMDINRSCW